MHDLQPLSRLDMARMRALRNGIYHSLRRGFYERWERILILALVLLTTAVALSFITGALQNGAFLLLTAATALVAFICSLWSGGHHGTIHASLQRRSYDLLAEANGLAEDEDGLAAEIERGLSMMYGDEPPTMHAVNAMAYNAVQNAYNRDPADHLPVGWFERVAANWLAFSPDRFRPAPQILN